MKYIGDDMNLITKHIVMWSLLVGAAILVFILFKKTSILTSVFIKDKSPLYVDWILFLLGVHMVIARGIAIFKKLTER